MNNNKQEISNNYKDYKYIYTGYQEYIKEHHLDKKEIKEEKEKIIHDHRLAFDFNNPNQHTHDYSFDFNNEKASNPSTKGNPLNSKFSHQENTKNKINKTNPVNQQNILYLIIALPIIIIYIFSIFIQIINSIG